MSDDQTYADVLNCAAKLLAWKAAQRRVSSATDDKWLLAAALCINLSDEYQAKGPKS